MQMHNQDPSRQNRFSAFWDRMAQSYPLPFDDKALADTRRVLSFVKSKGVDFSQMTILDIGCGAGTYALPLACEAAMVTGLDDSEAMIARMTEVMQSRSIQNVQPVKASWKDIDISVRGFEKAFDIAWISMSPAVQTAQDFMRMEKCAREWCVFIGWGRKRINILMEEVFRLHDIHFGPPPGVGAAYDILKRCGRNPSIDYFETSWEWKGTAEDALEDMVCYIEMQGGTANKELIKKTIACHERGGLIGHTTEVEEGILVWKVA